MVCIATDSSHTKLPLWNSLNYRCSVPSDVGGSKQNLTLEPFDHYLNRKWATAFIFFQELLIEVLGSTRVRATICNISCSQTWNRQWTEILCPHLSGKEDQSLDVQYSTLWTHYFSEACRQASLLRWVLGPVVILCILEGTISRAGEKGTCNLLHCTSLCSIDCGHFCSSRWQHGIWLSVHYPFHVCLHEVVMSKLDKVLGKHPSLPRMWPHHKHCDTYIQYYC